MNFLTFCSNQNLESYSFNSYIDYIIEYYVAENLEVLRKFCLENNLKGGS